MGLETVAHVQDLNSSWPLGSDLASTSDDHLRNIKVALKADFPNFNGTVNSATAPIFGIPGDTNTGMYGSAADTLGFSTGGTLRLSISTTAFTGTLPWQGQDGSAATPAISFSGDTDVGLYRIGANQLGIAVAGALHFDISASRINVPSAQFQAGDGAVGAPIYSFSSDSDTGIYRIGANQLGIVIGGTAAIDIASSRIYFNNTQLETNDGSAAVPVYSFANDTDTGIYRAAANQIDFSIAGSHAASVRSNGGIPTLHSQGHAFNDGVTAPSQQPGVAIMYVDSADGDLKIIFGDGTVKTIVADT